MTTVTPRPRRHNNPDGWPGGLVDPEAWVAPTAWVGRHAHVAGNASVQGRARIEGDSVVRDAALVTDRARVDDATVAEFAAVGGEALVEGGARVGGHAEVADTARVLDCAQVAGNTVVRRAATVEARARVFGDACLDGRTVVSLDGYVFAPRHVLVVGPVGSENRHVTVYRTRGGGHLIVAGCWRGTAAELAARIAPDGGHGWHHDDRQALWRGDYHEVLRLVRLRALEWATEGATDG